MGKTKAVERKMNLAMPKKWLLRCTRTSYGHRPGPTLMGESHAVPEVVPMMDSGKRLSGARFSIGRYALVHAFGHLDCVGCHHAKEDPGYFGEFIASLDFAQTIVILVIAVATF